MIPRRFLPAAFAMVLLSTGCMHLVKKGHADADVAQDETREILDANIDGVGDGLLDVEILKDVPVGDVDVDAADVADSLDLADPGTDHLDTHEEDMANDVADPDPTPDAKEAGPEPTEPGEEAVEQADAPDTDVCPAEPCLPADHPELVPDPCQVLAWDALACACGLAPRAIGEACDDDDRCSLSDACDADGTCAGVVPNGACDDGNPCTDDACDTALGCVFTANTDDCNDGSPCSLDDRCDGGECIGVPDPRLMDWGCDCELAEATYCEDQFTDGDACNGILVCVAHVCLIDFSTKTHCPTPEPGGCTTYRCNATTGGCDPVAQADDLPCSDGDPCTVDDACQGGECQGVVDSEAPGCACSEGNDRCEELLGDGDLCNGMLHCVNGACALDATTVAGPCDMAGDTPCTKNLCNPLTGQCNGLALQDGTQCEDGNPCTFGETCHAQVCEQGTVRDCANLESACAAWACDTKTGQCTPAPKKTCVDYADSPTNAVPDLCTLDYCVPASGDCLHAPRTCADADACTLDSCNPTTGKCQRVLLATGVADPCDGVDNDCDGATDEDFAQAPTECGIGSCAATGYRTCVGGATGDTCQAGTPALGDATCDGKDEDCNGATDDGYVPVVACFLPGACAVTNTASTCVDGVETACKTGTPEVDDVTCDAIDDDCDGATDDDYVPVVTCFLPGACAVGNIASSCAGGVENPCTTGEAAADDATCDAIDDDCDGDTNEDFVPDATCGVGYCKAHNTPSSCAAGVVTPCTLGAKLSTTDTTCDGVDDDCDGTNDENAVCDDGNKCNGISTCVSGSCQQTTAAVTCTALDACHVAGTCNASTGTCSNPEKCAAGSTCVGGVCCACTSGVCCDGCDYRPASYKCEDNVTTEYVCYGTECGADVYVIHEDRYCSGTSAACNGPLLSDTAAVHDNCTSEEKCTSGDSTCNADVSCSLTVTDPATGLVWQKTPASKSWESAKRYCNENQAGLPGTGWRLPNISELRSLIRGCAVTVTGGACGVIDECSACGVTGSCLSYSCWSGSDCSACPSGGGPAGGCYWDANLQGNCAWFFWSSSLRADSPGYAWDVLFVSGYVGNDNVDYGGRGVRCVRAGP